MRKYFLQVIIGLALIGTSFAVCTPPTGMGCDVPTNLASSPSGSDGTIATFSFDTTQSSDTWITEVDVIGNAARSFYFPAMVSCTSGVCHHSVTVTQLNPGKNMGWFASACTHATSGNIGTRCPLTSPDWSSSGPSYRESTVINGPGGSAVIRTLPLQSGGTLSSWWIAGQTPTVVFPGQQFYTHVMFATGVGTFGVVPGCVGAACHVNALMMHDVTIDTPSGTVQCGTHNTAHNPDYWQYGNINGTATCQGLSAANDFTITFDSSSNFIAPTTSNSTYNSFFFTSTSSPYAAHNNFGYYFFGYTGNSTAQVSIVPGSSIAPGNYTVHAHFQPLYSDGSGNAVGETLVSQDKTLDMPFTVEAITPIATTTFTPPTWTFLPLFTAMSQWWGTAMCSNVNFFGGGTGLFATMNNSGVYENVTPSPNLNFTSSSLAWVYDGGRNKLSLQEQLYPTGVSTYSPWVTGHVYTLGDHVTISGTTYVLHQMGTPIVATPGLTGTSGTATFDPTPGNDTIDSGGSGGPLIWMSLGTINYFRGCALTDNDGWRNNQLITQGTNFSEPTQWLAGIVRLAMQTGDASPGDSTGFSYSEMNQHYGQNSPLYTFNVNPRIQVPHGSPVVGMDPTMTASGTSSSWVGGSNLLMGYATDYQQNNQGATVNDNYVGIMRARGLRLQAQVGDWALRNDPQWINTLNGAFTKRSVESNLALLNIFYTLTPEQLQGLDGNNSAMAPFYQSGQISEALLHYYQATIKYSNTTNYPCDGTHTYPSGVYGPTNCVTVDERIPIRLKEFADAVWVNDFSRIYDQNDVLADACQPAHPTICQLARRLSGFSFPYDRWQLVDPYIGNEYNTESASNGEIAWVYAWLCAKNQTLVPPSNGRFTVASYCDIAELIFQHAFDGRSEVLKTSTTGSKTINWEIADYVNGGSSTGSGFRNLVVNNKQPQQDYTNITSEGLPWLTGLYTWDQGIFTQAVNKCWISANRNTTPGPHFGECTVASPLPDVMPPIPFNVYSSGPRPGVAEPAICIPQGSIANYKNSTCASPNFGVNGAGQMRNVGLFGTTAVFTFMTIKKPVSACIVVGITTVEPTHITSGPSQNYFCATASPALVTGVPLPMWFNSINVTNLTLSQIYHFGMYITDSAGNCFNFPYQLGTGVQTCGGGTTNKYAISGGQREQALTFSTFATPVPGNVVIKRGVKLLPGDTVR